ncbi:short chain dehydrogenase/reductase [Desulfosarcina variabilis str. Montpellier]|uniref:SDR family oxidoreductase n=1 Tax=Desulfosarcina variabilis TaxID=2300 RepID=UPI003AFB5F6C
MPATSNRQKRFLVTGSTDGIGRLTARRLAKMGHAVLVHGRRPDTVQAVADDIRRESGNPEVSGIVADFSSLFQVRHMGNELGGRIDRLDVLINNAGVLPAEAENGSRPFSEDGHELCMAVNYLAPFLLTGLLMPILRASPGARVLNVSSTAQATVDLDDLMLEKGAYAPMEAYARSKLALAMFTMELSVQLEKDDVTVNCLHPGSLLDTKMVRRAFGRPQGSAASGADVQVYLATAPELAGVSGVYFDRKTRSRAHEQAYDRGSRERLWRQSLSLTGLVTDLTS